MTIGVYAGSFDPITKGHLAVIRQALKVVDTLHVVVAFNPAKNGMFDMKERLFLIHTSLKEELAYIAQGRIIVEFITNSLTVEYAKRVDANVLVRGLRNGTDYAYERSQAAINGKLAPEIETIFIPTPVSYEEVSSSTVKGLMKFEGGEVAAREFVTPSVLEAIKNRSHF
jgi:pantetheine-phosphate adenylyltransferase